MLTEQNGIQVDKFYPPTDWQYSFPEGYTRLEYLESTGTQYIDTNYFLQSNNLKANIKFECDFDIVAERDLIGNQDGSTNRFIVGTYNHYIFGYSRNSSGQDSNVVTANYSGKQIIELQLNYNYTDSTKTLVANGITTTNSYVRSIYPSNNNIQIFGAGTGEFGNFVGKIYYCQIFDNNTLIRNMVPAKRNSDNKPGMYDLVNNVFYVNQGTGEFVMGPELYSNNSQINIRQKNNTNFVEKYKFNANNELIWANPQLNLSGPVGYTKVGNPTITDNVVSGFSASNYLKIGQIPTVQNRLERQVKIKTSNTTGSTQTIMSTGAYAGIRINDANQIGTIVYINGSYSNITLNTVLNGNTEYIYKDVFENGTLTIYLYNYQMVLLETKSASIGFDENTNYNLGQSSGRIFTGSIDLKETYIKVNNKLWFYGKNYTSENYAPVPAGLNYNNTTTPSIGYVNTQTQEFIPAPTDGIKYSQTRDIKVIPPEDNTITLLYGTQESHHLPSEYEELQAIQSSGTQYINTGIKVKDSLSFEFKFKYISLINTYNNIMGARTSGGSNSPDQISFTVAKTELNNYIGWGLKEYAFPNNTIKVNTDYNCIFNKNNFMLNNIIIVTGSDYTGNFTPSDLSIYLFGRNSNGSLGNASNSIIYNFKCYDNGTLVRNLIPARRKSDSAVGMYDLVEGEFLENQGTGTFTAVELKYKLFGLLANTSSGNYDVYIDDILYATTASGTQTDIDFSALGSEYVSIGTATTPEELILHKIVIKPTTSGETITQFNIQRTIGATGTQQNGIIWCHLELDNIISLRAGFGYVGYYSSSLMYALTAKNDFINNNNYSMYTVFAYTTNLRYIAKFNNLIDSGSCFRGNRNIKRIRFNKFNNNSTYTFEGSNILEKIETKEIASGSIYTNVFNNNYELKMLPIKNTGSNLSDAIINAKSLYPTNLDISNNNTTTRLGMYGSSTYPMRGLRGLKVSNEAPFTGTSPQINVSYTGLDRDALVELFNSLPDVSEATDGITRAINITAATGNNLTKVGTGVTIDENGVASGLDSSNYIQLGTCNELANKDWKIVLKVYWDGSSTTTYCQVGDNNSYFRINNNGGLTFNGYLTTNAQVWCHNGSKLFSSSSWYYIVLEYKYSTGTFTTYYGTDLNNLAKAASTIKGANLQLRYLDSSHYIMDKQGTIDLENTYIKVGQNYLMKGYLTDNDRLIATNKGWNITG